MINFFENTSYLYAIIFFLLLVVIFILFLYLRQKKQLAKEKSQTKITKERIDLFLAASSDRETMFEEISKVNSKSLGNRYLKEKIKSRLLVRSHDIYTFSKIVSMTESLPDDNRLILEDLLVDALLSKPPYYLGGLLSRSIIETPVKLKKENSRLIIEKIINMTDIEYRQEVLESAAKYVIKYTKRKVKNLSDVAILRLKNEVGNLKNEILKIKE